jgi:arsenate reductase
MYFATLTEVRILQGLIGTGMGRGPALVLLLAAPVLSLPNMPVIRSVMGTRKTVVFVPLVVAMSTLCGMLFGHFFPGWNDPRAAPPEWRTEDQIKEKNGMAIKVLGHGCPKCQQTEQVVKEGVSPPEEVPMEKRKILFLCTGNSCRSQMAEGLTRHLHGDRLEPYSAGVDPHPVDPRAVKAMAEAGVDISKHRSKDVSEFEALEFDYVVTVCDRARESCPFFPAKTRVLHQGFDDPPKLAVDSPTEEEAMAHYRRVREEIRAFVQRLPEVLGE